MEDSYIMSLARKIEMFAAYPGAQEKEDEWKKYFVGEYFQQYR